MWIWQQPDWPQGRLAIMPLLSEMSATQAVMSPLVAQGQQLKARQRLRLEATLLSEEMEACARLSGVVFGRAALRDALYQALGLESGQLEAPRGQVPGIDVFVDVMLEVVRTAFQPLAREQVLEWHRRLGPFLPRSSGQRLGEWRDGPHEAVSGRYGLKRLRYRAPGMTGDELADELERFWQRLEEEEPEAGNPGVINALRLHAHWQALSPLALGNGLIGRLLLTRWLTRVDTLAALQQQGEWTGQVAKHWEAEALEQLCWRRQTLFTVVAERQEELRELEQHCLGTPGTSPSGQALPPELNRALNGDAADEVLPGDMNAWVAWWLRQLRDGGRRTASHYLRVQRAERLWMEHARTPLNSRQRELVLTLLERDDDEGIGRAEYRALVETSDPTAARDLADLTAKQVLESYGVGRGTRYRLPVFAPQEDSAVRNES
ncbi:hypothetical protein FBG13_14405 [Cobetia marina]|jgi:Fic family protein|uniref:DUF4172 domain-containing protein n=1 Tax=Cobetia marina TaxID=28258 RepID=A0ABU9GER8_COBMA|nr:MULTISPECIES: DUF4172 domain-containing protein [Cobetia]MDN2656299.1 DUF4172 domain-containing protein [Cobetia sp. 14N.309.X.WAT.E.A4]MDO6787462.1 DUF4172 domain-containing protein [Cobetia marina]TKD61133.1 hypothetical protein FBG13_14405 [Cobetia marina]GED41333.1 hypothetical protein HHA02_06620 [Cobetia marina]